MANPVATPSSVVPESAWYVDSGGQLRQIPAAKAPDAEALGWSPATAERIRGAQLEEKFGGLGGELKAGAAAAVRAATFGLSDVALTKTGLVEPETLKGLEEANPLATGTGTVLGIAAPILLSGGAAAPAEAAAQAGIRGAIRTAARISGPSVVSRAGQAVTKAVEAALPEAEGLVGKVVSKAVSAGAGSAIEGAAYGLGQEVSEVALGDHNLTAQSVLAHVGPLAILGGGLGAVLGAATVAVPAAVGKVQTALSSAVTKAKEAYPELAERLTAGRISAETVRELQAKYSSAFKDPRQAWRLQQDLGGSLEDLANSVADAKKTLYTEAWPAEAKALLGEPHAVPTPGGGTALEYVPRETAVRGAQRTLDSLTEAADKIRSQPDLYEQGFAAKLEEIRNGLMRRAADGDPVQIFGELRQARQQVDSFGRWNTKSLANLPFKEREAVQIVRDVRSAIRNTLHDESLWGAAAARQATLDSLQSDYLQALGQLTGGGLSPLKSNLLRKGTIRGQEELRINPRALKTFLNQMADPRGSDYVGKAIGDYLEASGKYLDGMRASFEHVPAEAFDHAALSALTEKTGTLVEQAKSQASVTQLMNELTPGASFAAGGAKALLPPATSGGAIGGLMTLGAAPIAGHFVPGLGPLTAIYGAGKAVYHIVEGLKNVPQTVAMLARLERVIQKVNSVIDTGASTLVRGGVKAGYVGRAEVAAGLAREFGSSAEDASRRFSHRVAEIQKLSQDPETLHTALTNQNEQLDQHAPNTSQALGIASARAVSFLASKLPQDPQRGPLAPKWEPSQSEIARFSRYYEAISDPLTILKQAAAGTLTSEAIEAVQVVYPELFARIQEGLITKLTSHGGTVPAQSRLGLSMLLGQDLDGSLGMLQTNQATHQGSSNKQGAAPQQPRPTSKGLGRLSVSQRALTPMQSSAQRRS